MNGIIIAILCAIVWSFLNVYDKLIIEKRVKNVYGFSLLCGVQNIIVGGILACFVTWNNITTSDLWFAAIAGALLAVNMIIYFKLLSEYNVSDILGLYYTYPVLTAIISFISLHERLSISKYVAIVIIIIGVLVFNKYLKKKSISFKLLIFIPYLLVSALYEIFMKLASSTATPVQGVILNSVALGVISTLLLINYGRQFVGEIRNVPFSLISMLITYGAVFLSYVSLLTIPATYLAAIGASQPIFSLVFEKIASLFEKSIKSIITVDKLIGMLLVAFGVVLLSL